MAAGASTAPLLEQDSFVLGATIYQLEISGWKDYSIAGNVTSLLIQHFSTGEGWMTGRHRKYYR